jgi:cytochrome P450
MKLTGAAVTEHPHRPAEASPVLFDPFAPGFTDDPYPRYAELRSAAPVYEHPLGFWVLSDYDSVSALLRSGASVSDRHRADSPIRELAKAAYGEQPLTINQSMLDLDPPDHTRLRRLVTKALLPVPLSDCARGSRHLPTRHWTGSLTTVRQTWWPGWRSRCRLP